jgi:hypothetical protein
MTRSVEWEECGDEVKGKTKLERQFNYYVVYDPFMISSLVGPPYPHRCHYNTDDIADLVFHHEFISECIGSSLLLSFQVEEIAE